MKFLRKISLVVIGFLMTFAPTNSAFAALSESQLNFYAQNNILFYDPGGGEGKGFECIVYEGESLSTGSMEYCIGLMVEGGLTDELAQALANYYNSGAVDASFWGLPNGKMNCVSFSAWFVQELTSIGKDPHMWGNGGEVAMNLSSRYDLPMGTEPVPFSVFSTGGNSGYGHTGVIVAVDGDDITIVDASYPTENMAGSMARVRHVDRSYFNGGSITYLDSVLDEGKLSSITGG